MPLGVDDPNDNFCRFIPQVLLLWEENTLDGDVGELDVNRLGDVERPIGLVTHTQFVGIGHTLGSPLDLHLQRSDHSDQLVFDLRECGTDGRSIGSSRPGSLDIGDGLPCLDCGSGRSSFGNFPLDDEDLCLDFHGIFLMESGVVELPAQEVQLIFRTWCCWSSRKASWVDPGAAYARWSGSSTLGATTTAPATKVSGIHINIHHGEGVDGK